MISYKKDYQYADFVLKDSLVRYKNKPVLVNKIDRIGGVHGVWYKQPDLGVELGGLVQLEDLDLTPIELGYMNVFTHSKYIQRMAARKWRQGLTRHNCNYSWSFNKSYYVKALIDLVDNKYPPFTEAYKMVSKEGYESVGFHKKWALKRAGNTVRLLYRDKIVSNPTSKYLRLNKKFSFLGESLNEAGFPQHQDIDRYSVYDLEDWHYEKLMDKQRGGVKIVRLDGTPPDEETPAYKKPMRPADRAFLQWEANVNLGDIGEDL